MFTSPQLTRFETDAGFIAALDQSGGSTPGALARYGIDESAYASEDEMFDLVHAMRTRVITDPAFSGGRILGTILFQGTVDREIEGKGVADYVWSERGVLPFLKIDKGLEEERLGVRMMKDIPGLDATLAAAKAKGVFGTKERSVIRAADAEGIGEIAVQQFALGRRVLEAELMPILEPEIDIHIPDKEEAEYLLEAELRAHLDDLGDAKVALKLTLPTRPGLYDDVVAHPNVARVVALSGGYTRDEANALLARNHGMIASFSRALLEGLRVDQTDDEFHAMLDVSIESIFQASKT